jgi:hypothetical protein
MSIGTPDGYVRLAAVNGPVESNARGTVGVVVFSTLRLRPRPGCEDDYRMVRPHLLRNRSAVTAERAETTSA